ncbi:hypothetical protein ACSNOI_05585 [Actinomadura kijaniata]|uniref:hypothetical protein n=1 Tax=Actinomadura kijaniata TaxID=46161 RepID=UPI003F1C39D5
MRSRQRPANARAAADGMKLHRRTLRLDGRAHTVVGLRPETAVRFSTNLFHGTWHVLSDRHGARLLGRLLWGLAYQSRPGTLVVIDREFVAPTPFDADPGDPIVLVPAWETPFTGKVARDLKARLPLTGAPDGTVRWRTHGLDAALADEDAWWARQPGSWEWDGGRVRRANGMVVLGPSSPAEARNWGVVAARLDPHNPHGMDYEYLGRWDHGQDGEIQIFRHFHRMVSVARRARAEVLRRPDAPAEPGELRPLVWAHSAQIEQRGP